MHSYEDFTIRIGPRRDDGYAVSVVDSPSGTGSGTLHLPLGLDDLGEFLEALGPQVRGDHVRDMGHTPQSPAWEADGSDGIGRALFDALFSGDVLTLLDQSLGRVGERQRTLRIKISLDIEDPTLAPLASLPWELLCRWRTREYLAHSGPTTIVRFLDVLQSNESPPFEPPLRILVVAANPYEDLALQDEIDLVEETFRGAEGFEVDFLQDATYRELEVRLNEKPYHGLHFMGHGTFDGDRGALMFAGGLDGAGDPVKGDDLGTLLRRSAATQFVLLNACSTARVTSRQGQDPFAGVATALVMAGVPAVVAMQFPITDIAAIAFAERFYKLLAAGRPIEDAVAEGRMAIKGKRREKLEWATPVLFLQSAAEKLFNRGRSQTPKQQPPVHSADELRLQPYMVDRVRVVDELGLAIRRDLQRKDTPLVCIIHGDNEQCQTSLRDRLCSHELPRLLGLKQQSESIKSFHLEWPKEYADQTTFHDLLTWKLTDQTLGGQVPERGEGAAEAIRDHFFSRMPAAMLHSTVYSSEWPRYPRSLIEDYVAYWQRWPRSPAQRLLIFLMVTYQTNPNLNWFKRRQQAKMHETIEHALQTLNPDAFEGVVVRVLPRLGDVTIEDAERWADDHGHADLKPEIRAAFADRTAMQMEVLTRTLHQLLEQKYAHVA